MCLLRASGGLLRPQGIAEGPQTILPPASPSESLESDETARIPRFLTAANKENPGNGGRYDMSHVVAVYDGSDNWPQSFVWNDEVDGIEVLEQKDVLDYDTDGNTTEVTRSYYHRNTLGSVMEITDANESVVVSYRYDPYGEVAITVGGIPQSTDPLGQHWTFTGRFLDWESGLYYYRARWYDPVIGRFMSRDPLGYGVGPNLFSYCDSNPVSRVDPDGLQFKSRAGHQRPTGNSAYDICMGEAWAEADRRWAAAEAAEQLAYERVGSAMAAHRRSHRRLLPGLLAWIGLIQNSSAAAELANAAKAADAATRAKHQLQRDLEAFLGQMEEECAKKDKNSPPSEGAPPGDPKQLAPPKLFRDWGGEEPSPNPDSRPLSEVEKYFLGLPRYLG